MLRDPGSSSSRECLKLMSDVSLSDVGLEVGELRDKTDVLHEHSAKGDLISRFCDSSVYRCTITQGC